MINIFVVRPYGLDDGIVEKVADVCADGRFRVDKVNSYYHETEWLDPSEVCFSKRDALALAESIRVNRMKKLKEEYDHLAQLEFV